MGTYASIQTRVLRRVIDLPTAVSTEVPALVLLALSKLQEKHNWKVMEAQSAAFTTVNYGKLTTAAGNSVDFTLSLEYPTIKEFRGEPFFLQFTDGSPRFMSLAQTRADAWGAFADTLGTYATPQIGYPQLLRATSAGVDNTISFQVFPFPDGASDYSDGEYRVVIPTWAYLPALTDSQSNWFTAQPSGEEYIVNYASAEAFILNWDFEKAAVFTAKAEQHYKDLVIADKRFRLGSVNEFVPHWRGVHQNRTRL